MHCAEKAPIFSRMGKPALIRLNPARMPCCWTGLLTLVVRGHLWRIGLQEEAGAVRWLVGSSTLE